jgi:MoxR-like ATPase
LATHQVAAASAEFSPIETAEGFAAAFDVVHDRICQVIQGKEDAVRLALICVISEGHLLVEDVPGVGKTSLAKALARSLGLSWNRIQFTPDLLPSDVTGVSVFERATNTFTFRPGGIFANVLLGDEINRASPKTQAALLEAMEERQVTVDATTHLLPEPFVVIATQNPVEHEGTYPLPESQLDRFLLRIRMGYPARAAEIAMLDNQAMGSPVDNMEPAIDAETVAALIHLSQRVHIAPALKGYMVDLAAASRRHPALLLGMSPRSVLGLQRAVRALAASLGRDYVIPDDIKALFAPIVEHRLILLPEMALNQTTVPEVVSDLLRTVPVPSARAGLA